MSHLSDLIAAFKFNPDTFNEDQFKTALLDAYTQDEQGWTSVLAEKDTALTQAEADKRDLAAENWKLFTRSGTPIPPDNASGSQVPPPAGQDPSEPELKGTDSFFTPKE